MIDRGCARSGKEWEIGGEIGEWRQGEEVMGDDVLAG